MQHKWAKEIKAWADGAEIEARFNDQSTFKREGFWTEWEEMDSTCRFSEDDLWEYRIKPPAKCIVKDCMNHTNEGKFVGELCAPCWDYLTNGNGVHSQAYRNAQPKEPQYLYVYIDYGGITLLKDKIEIPVENVHYIGKIKLEDE